MSTWVAVSWSGLLIASSLVVASGLLKVLHPEGVEPLLAVMRVPPLLRRGRLVGVAEAGIGAAAILTTSRDIRIAEAAMFAAFALVIGYVLARRVPLASCGCAGSRQTPPSPIHVIVNLSAAAAAAAAAAVQAPALADAWPTLAWLGIPTALGGAAAVFLILIVLGPLAELLQNCRRVRAAGLVYQNPHPPEVAS